MWVMSSLVPEAAIYASARGLQLSRATDSRVLRKVLAAVGAYLTQADGTKKRESLDVEVRQFDVVVAKGKTPSATADMNEFLSIRVPQGVRYQIVIPGQDPNRPRALEAIAPKNKEEFLRVKLELK